MSNCKIFLFFKRPLRILGIIIMGKKFVKKVKVTAFIKKLVKILDDQKFCGLIAWLPQQTGFQILNVTKFSEEALPYYFKHKNLASFIRQLNMYGFSRPKQSNQYVYCHPRFKKNNTNSLRLIQRKNGEVQDEGSSSSNEEFICQYKTSQNISIQDNCNKLSLQNQELKKINADLKNQLYCMASEFNKLCQINTLFVNQCENRKKQFKKETEVEETELSSEKSNQGNYFYSSFRPYGSYYPIVLLDGQTSEFQHADQYKNLS